MNVWSVKCASCILGLRLGVGVLTVAWSSSSKSSTTSCRHVSHDFKYTSMTWYIVNTIKIFCVWKLTGCTRTCTVVWWKFLRSGLWHAEWEREEESKQGKKCVKAGWSFHMPPTSLPYNNYKYHWNLWFFCVFQWDRCFAFKLVEVMRFYFHFGADLESMLTCYFHSSCAR